MAMNGHVIYQFDGFRLDPAARVLSRGDEDLMLPGKVFDGIVALIENQDRAVSRDELIATIWGKSYLTDNALDQIIRQARRVLCDNGDDQRVIKTVRGFGYRWAIPVETIKIAVEELPDPEPLASMPDNDRRRFKPAAAWLALAAMIAGILGAGSLYWWQGDDSRASSESLVLQTEDEIALLLPVTMEPGDEHAWVRLGLMDLINQRLRAAGQAMVPSDTVIALLRGLPDDFDPHEVDKLTAPTGARLVLAARAQVTGSRWLVSLRTLTGIQPPLSAVGEAHDVLEAARIAADRMAVSFGLTPIADSHIDPDLQRLLQKIEAARLAQQIDTVRTLIEQADPELRGHPEVRFQWARVQYFGGLHNDARASFESLLGEPAIQDSPVLQARVMQGLAAINHWQGDLDTSERLLTEAARLFGEHSMHQQLAQVQTNLGILASTRGDYDAARTQYAQARRIFEGVGDTQALANLDHSTGILEIKRERPAIALRYFESAAERFRAIQNVGGELRARANAILAYLMQLDPLTASAMESRIQELLAQTTSTEQIAHANINRIRLFAALGWNHAAESLMNDDWVAAEGGSDLPHLHRMYALLLRAEWAIADEDDPTRAADLATRIVEGFEDVPEAYAERARAWLILVRAHLALGNSADAADAAAAMMAWARRDQARTPMLYAVLAEAELAAARHQTAAAAAAFERALALAESGHVPLHLLQVAQKYLPWLLDRTEEIADAKQRALFVADLLGGYADQYYDAALLQLRTYHALGPPTTWRMAFERASALAGERLIPTELSMAP